MTWKVVKDETDGLWYHIGDYDDTVCGDFCETVGCLGHEEKPVSEEQPPSPERVREVRAKTEEERMSENKPCEDDLVSYLRTLAYEPETRHFTSFIGQRLGEAANELLDLRAENERLREENERMLIVLEQVDAEPSLFAEAEGVIDKLHDWVLVLKTRQAEAALSESRSAREKADRRTESTPAPESKRPDIGSGSSASKRAETKT